MWFCSMTVAEKITGINQGDISRCTLGKTDHAGGYVWETVKQGGVSDDVCEWTSTQINSEWKPSCEPNSTYNVFGVAWFRKCPYCGKKIKVVKQMNTRKVDKSKKSNIKCEHCEAYDKDSGWCCIQEKEKNYWNRCKDFIWHHKY